MNTCIKCNVSLDGTNSTWYRIKNYIYKCNSCIKKEKAEWARKKRAADPQGNLDRSYTHRQNVKNNNPIRYTASQQRSSASKRAKALGLRFNLTTDYIQEISPDKCPILGITIKYGGGDKSKYSASLDRIEPAKGYVIGNVQIICNLANMMKSNATEDELSSFAKWVLANN